MITRIRNLLLIVLMMAGKNNGLLKKWRLPLTTHGDEDLMAVVCCVIDGVGVSAGVLMDSTFAGRKMGIERDGCVEIWFSNIMRIWFV